ncbi:uncharacterized protein KY384_000891 [Bacidia gigantensis]|uniref:uncharacterized protein n=1 Tax=Bacidia gigantensis TaxID=2732470 RepID=UPI001D04E664|nr:uncharacterized protein KY384_000891 [Bacidia gigantensis]KAG8534048.1 hypothetical protein KY384_000891 [Bacidia gigantensis]
MSPVATRLPSEVASYKPLGKIPERRSSRFFTSQTGTISRVSPSSNIKGSSTPYPLKASEVVEVRGTSASPIRRPSIGRARSRTFVPVVPPDDILGIPVLKHRRIQVVFRLSAPLFIGGATVEGEVHLKIDPGSSKARRKTLPVISIHRVSINVLGVEYCKGRQEIFRALTSTVVHPQDDPITKDTVRSFSIDLPMEMGPAPYETKRAGIRETKEILVLTVQDPAETALMNLSNPVVVSDDLKLSGHGVGLTAGIHRQTWISGYTLFMDLRVHNGSRKPIRRLELQLERVTVFYTHPVPSSDKVKSDIRLPDELLREILTKKNVLRSHETIDSLAEDYHTVQLELPAGLVSIETGRFFGVRFFLVVKLYCSFHKRLQVQLPINIIHPNTIDIPPNSLAQVAASIEQNSRKTSTATSSTITPHHLHPGHAFTVARRQSFLNLRQDTIGTSDMHSLTRALEGSPRRFPPQTYEETSKNTSSPLRKMKITRRQSTLEMGSSGSGDQRRFSSSRQDIKQPKKPLSYDQSLRYKFSRTSSSNKAPKATNLHRVSLENTSFDDPSPYRPLHYQRRSSSDSVSFDGTVAGTATAKPKPANSTRKVSFEQHTQSLTSAQASQLNARVSRGNLHHRKVPRYQLNESGASTAPRLAMRMSTSSIRHGDDDDSEKENLTQRGKGMSMDMGMVGIGRGLRTLLP